MRKNIIFLLAFVMTLFASPCMQAAHAAVKKLSPQDLEALVGPIALYPDPILSLMLPASTFPEQIIDAALLIKDESDAELISKQSWDQSVKGVAAYPGILKMMYDELGWTMKLGTVFVAQSEDLRAAIQELRLRAQKYGNLKSSAEQTVSTKDVNGEQVVVIEPTQPEVVYVPQYNTEVVYTQPAPASSNYLAPLATFGLGMALGAAMADDDDDDHYYYGGYPGGVAWYDGDDVDHWMEERQERLRDSQEHRQEMRKDRQDFRQDRIESGNTLTPEQRQQAATKAQERRSNISSSANAQNLEARKQQARTQAQNRASTARNTTSDRGYGGGSPWAKDGAKGWGTQGSSSRSAFSGYSSRSNPSLYSSRGSASRSASNFRGGGFQSAGMRGGGSRGGGGGRRR